MMENYVEFNQKEFNRWISDKGDETCRLNYNLNKESLVIDAGGFRGEWSEKIFNRFGCNIYIFEPIKSYYDIICNKFKDNERVKVFQYGLSNENKEIDILLSNDASSVFDNGDGDKETIQLKSLVDFIDENGIKKIDLIKINIEGGEYDLLEDVINKKRLDCFVDLQIQYHRFIENCDKRRDFIRENLVNTHYETYNYEFIWENWKIKQ